MGKSEIYFLIIFTSHYKAITYPSQHWGAFKGLVMRYPIGKSNRSEVCSERSNHIFSSHLLVMLYYKFQQFQTLLPSFSQLQAKYLNLISFFSPLRILCGTTDRKCDLVCILCNALHFPDEVLYGYFLWQKIFWARNLYLISEFRVEATISPMFYECLTNTYSLEIIILKKNPKFLVFYPLNIT